MKNLHIRGLLSVICVASILAGFSRVNAAPVRFDQVVQVINARPGKADSVSFTRLRVVEGYDFLISADDDDDKKKKEAPQQDGRVITTTTTDIVKDEVCDCQMEEHKGGFPKWALLGLAAIPVAFILIKKKKDTPTPTQTIPNMTPTPTGTPTGTPTATPTGTPSGSPTPTPTGSQTATPTPTVTPTITPTITPTVSPTPPEPVPEPMTILLFGTGLASIGLAARRKYGKKGERGDEKDEE